MTIEQGIEEFLDYAQVERGLVPETTLRNYRFYLYDFLGWLKEKSLQGSEPAGITQDLVWAYRLYLSRKVSSRSGKTITRTSQRYFLIALRGFLRFLSKRGIRSLPPDQVDLPRPEPRRIKFLDARDMVRLLGAPKVETRIGVRDRAILETLFSGGLRVAELAALDRDRINVKDGEFTVTGKGGRTRVVYLSESARRWVRQYLETRKDDDPALFVSYRGRERSRKAGRRLTPRSVERLVRKYCRLAGITLPATPHTLRHSFATDLLTHGADLRSVQELLGHKNVATTQIYTHLTNPQLREVHRRFHRGGSSR